MYTLGIIEESLTNKQVLEKLEVLLFSQRIEQVPADINSEWHINEYHIPDSEMPDLIHEMSNNIKGEYYIHAFDNNELIVILKEKYFCISRERDSSWDLMIEYGVSAGIDRYYLENIPLSV